MVLTISTPKAASIWAPATLKDDWEHQLHLAVLDEDVHVRGLGVSDLDLAHNEVRRNDKQSGSYSGQSSGNTTLPVLERLARGTS
jgi:hypothetical protein